MKDNYFGEINEENLDVAYCILEDSKNINTENVYDENLINNIDNISKTSQKKLHKKIYKVATAVAVCIVLMISINFYYANQVGIANKVINDGKNESKAEYVATKSYSEIYDRLMQVENEKKYGGVIEDGDMIMNSVLNTDEDIVYEESADDSKGEMSDESLHTEEYYNTNEQTEHVHEADIVKTDGRYIYSINDNFYVYITKVDGVDMEIVSKINIKKDEDDYTYEEMYVANDKLIIVGSKSLVHKSGIFEALFDINREVVRNTIVLTYDISDRTKPAIVSKNFQEGYYKSSRLVGDILYLVSTHNMSYITEDNCVPKVNDKQIHYECVYLPKNIDERSFTVVSTLNINDSNKFKKSVAVAGRATDIYVSEKNMYLINSFENEEDITDTKEGKQLLKKNNYNYEEENVSDEQKLTEYDREYIKDYYPKINVNKVKKYNKTVVCRYSDAIEIVKYSYDGENIEFVADTIVDGYVEDNLSFDEEKGYLRFVTTSGGYVRAENRDYYYDKNGELLYYDVTDIIGWENDEDINNVFVLDEKLLEVAHIPNLAKDERIYSARYYGDYGYFVTFRETDPLFSVDFSDIENPKIIGKLKIPGFSEYLHFYGDNRLLGFGIETDNPASSYGESLKLEMYDISDGSASQITKHVMDELYYSEALYNYKAIMVDKNKGYIGFSASSTGHHDEEYKQYYCLYTYQNESFEEVLRMELDGDSYGVRGLYIGDYLYVASTSHGIKAVDMTEYNPGESISQVYFD